MAHSPKLMQGLMAGVCDYYTFGLALKAFGPTAAGWALMFQVFSWFNFYCLVRPYSNSAEAVLATAALFYWAPLFMSSRPSAAEHKASGGSGDGVGGCGLHVSAKRNEGGVSSRPRETVALLLASLCVAVRPTSAALWVSLRK